jgi:hypothetical protein
MQARSITISPANRQRVVACAVHPNNAEVALGIEPQKLNQNPEVLLRNELPPQTSGATICPLPPLT